MAKHFWTHPATVLSSDYRSLAAFRIGIGFLLMLDVIGRLHDLVPFYTDFGVLPRGPYLEKFANRYHFSLYFVSGHEAWILPLFAIAFVAAFCLCIGYRTRLATVISWILLISIQNRNPVVLNGGDVLLRIILFWAIFLPTNRRCSVDAALSATPPPERNDFKGVRALLLPMQVFLLYYCTAVLKTGKEWWPDGSASYYALSLDAFVTRFGQWLVQFHEPLRYGTYFVYWLEKLAGFLIFCPFFYPQIRTAVLFCLFGMHLGFDLSMRIGLFPWIDTALLVGCLPGGFWDFLEKRTRSEKVTIYYDGDCGFCKKMVYLIRGFFLPVDTPIKRCQDEEDTRAILEDHFTWVVRTADGQMYMRGEALFVVLEHATLIGPLVKALRLRRLAPIVDPFYKFTATRRNAAGRLLTPLQWRDVFGKSPGLINIGIAEGLALFFAGYVVLWNFRGLPDADFTILHPWNRIASVLRIDQKWNMFAPYPLKNDGWFVIDGTLRNGNKVDVFSRKLEEVNWDKPDLISRLYANARWRKYLMNIRQSKRKKYRLYYGKYLCRSWNRGTSFHHQLETFTINYMQEKTRPPGEEQPIKKIMLWRHNCFKSESDKG